MSGSGAPNILSGRVCVTYFCCCNNVLLQIYITSREEPALHQTGISQMVRAPSEQHRAASVRFPKDLILTLVKWVVFHCFNQTCKIASHLGIIEGYIDRVIFH